MAKKSVIHVGLHIHKAAGTTLQVHFEAHRPWSFRTTAAQVNERTGRLPLNEIGSIAASHTTIVWGHQVSEAQLTQFQSPLSLFTFLREPVSRCVSWYDYERAEFGIRSTFEEFVDAHADAMCVMIVKSFPSLVSSSAKSLAEKAISVLEKFNFVGCQERFSDHAAVLLDDMGLPPIPADMRLNEKRGGSKTQLTDELKLYVVSKNKNDIELYERFFAGSAEAYRSVSLHNFAVAAAPIETLRHEFRAVSASTGELATVYGIDNVFGDALHGSARRLLVAYMSAPEDKALKIFNVLKMLAEVEGVKLPEILMRELRQNVQNGRTRLL